MSQYISEMEKIFLACMLQNKILIFINKTENEEHQQQVNIQNMQKILGTLMKTLGTVLTWQPIFVQACVYMN